MTGNTEVHGQNPNTQQAPLNAVQLRKLEQSVYAASLEYGKSKITTSE